MLQANTKNVLLYHCIHLPRSSLLLSLMQGADYGLQTPTYHRAWLFVRLPASSGVYRASSINRMHFEFISIKTVSSFRTQKVCLLYHFSCPLKWGPPWNLGGSHHNIVLNVLKTMSYSPRIWVGHAAIPPGCMVFVLCVDQICHVFTVFCTLFFKSCLVLWPGQSQNAVRQHLS